MAQLSLHSLQLEASHSDIFVSKFSFAGVIGHPSLRASSSPGKGATYCILTTCLKEVKVVFSCKFELYSAGGASAKGSDLSLGGGEYQPTNKAKRQSS